MGIIHLFNVINDIHAKRLQIIFQTILDFAKLHMFKFHYDIMHPVFDDKLEVCFTDTDSLLYVIKSSNTLNIYHHI